MKNSALTRSSLKAWLSSTPRITTCRSMLILSGIQRAGKRLPSIAAPLAPLCSIKQKKNRLSIKLILLTHAHPDHVADLDRLSKTSGAPIYISSREEAPGAQAIEEGKRFNVGKLQVESRLTWGHSPGGMTFVVSGLERPVAVVGD